MISRSHFTRIADTHEVDAKTVERDYQSDDGERFTERSLSASVTCRLQHRSLLAYLRDLHTTHQTSGALPALL